MNSSDEDDGGLEVGQGWRRGEAVRRAQLYGVSSTKRLPRVQVQPPDARARKELQLLAEPPRVLGRDGLSFYEDELELRKHHEHLGMRPALDQSHPLKDLYSTVPRLAARLIEHDKSETTAKHASEWRVGYKNDPQSDYHGLALRGVFEPSDTSRERLVETTEKYRLGATALAYPTPYSDDMTVAQELKPYDAGKARKLLDAKLGIGINAMSPTKKKPSWSPASSHAPVTSKTPKPKSKAARLSVQMNQRIPVRKAESPLEKVELHADPRHVRKQQTVTKRVNEAYTEIQRQAAQWKDPTVRYSLPVENPSCDRSYRLGLDPIDSSPAMTAEYHSFTEPDDQEETHESSLPHPQRGQSTRKARQKPPLLFRPKSAVTLRMETTMTPPLARASSSASLLSVHETVSKVAGAKRRPHSATISYLSNSTVYVMNPSTSGPSVHCAQTRGTSPSTRSSGGDAIAVVLVGNTREVLQEQRKYGAGFLDVVLEERVRRHALQQERFSELARRGLLHAIPIPQIFARLRREALKNLSKRIEYARYEKLSLEDYMSICGMAVVPETTPPRHDEQREMRPTPDDLDGDDDDQLARADRPNSSGPEDPVLQALYDEVELRQLPFDEPANSVFRKRRAIRPDPSNGNNSSTVQAMRRSLRVTREQFHIAMEAFALPPRDINLLFSSLDLNVDDNVPLWEIVCAVEQLQDGHEEIRRSRVQVKARDLPKELSALRQSVTVPRHTHVALPIDSR